MDLINLFHIVWRWFWLVLLVVAVSGAVAVYKVSDAPVVYEASVKIQVSSPPPVDVTLYDQYRSSNLRDDMTVATNNFRNLMQSTEVNQRTITQLGLTAEDADYSLQVSALGDSDFIYATAQARTPQLAQQIANAAVSIGITYYGEVSAKPAAAAGDSIHTQLQNAEKDLRTAQETLAAFQKENNITSLEDELANANLLIQRLQTDRNDLLVANKPTTAIDALIAQRRQEVINLQALSPSYAVLEENAKQAKAGYDLLLSKYQEAVLKVDDVRKASFMQVIEPASTPAAQVPGKSKTILGLTFAGSLGLGVLLALLLDSFRRARIDVDGPPQKKRKQEFATSAGQQVAVSPASSDLAPETAQQTDVVAHTPWFKA